MCTESFLYIPFDHEDIYREDEVRDFWDPRNPKSGTSVEKYEEKARAGENSLKVYRNT